MSLRQNKTKNVNLNTIFTIWSGYSHSDICFSYPIYCVLIYKEHEWTVKILSSPPWMCNLVSAFAVSNQVMRSSSIPSPLPQCRQNTADNKWVMLLSSSIKKQGLAFHTVYIVQDYLVLDMVLFKPKSIDIF